MSKIFQAFLSGVFFTFILDFFIFLGIKQNYIDKYDIPVYYNILFADNQNIFIFTFFTIILGYITIYLSHKISLSIVGLLFVLSISTLIEPIGVFTAKIILQKDGVTLQSGKYTYSGDIYYIGRKYIYMKDDRFDKMLLLDKQKTKGDF